MFSQDCSIRYIITVNALKEGWDCPFAYILATVANRTSVVDVEQILGRVLRMPGAKANKESVLNLSYVITSSNEFNATLDKVVAGLNAAGFSNKDYRVAEESVEEQKEEDIPTQITVNDVMDQQIKSQTEEVEDDEIPINTKHIREQLEDVFVNSVDTSRNSSDVNDMLTQAETQNNQYWEAAAGNAEPNNSFEVPTEVRDKMKRFRMVQRFEQSAKQIRLPQFKIEMPPTIFSDNETAVLTKESLYEDFTLSNKDTVIDFNNIVAQIAKVDIDEDSEDSTPKTWRLQGFDNPFLKEWYNNLSTEGKLRQCKDIIKKKVGKNNAINQRELDEYIDRVIAGLTSEQLDDLQQNPYLYSRKIEDGRSILPAFMDPDYNGNWELEFDNVEGRCSVEKWILYELLKNKWERMGLGDYSKQIVNTLYGNPLRRAWIELNYIYFYIIREIEKMSFKLFIAEAKWFLSKEEDIRKQISGVNLCNLRLSDMGNTTLSISAPPYDEIAQEAFAVWELFESKYR